jgi:SAM-dependent methyltransferase
MLDYAAERLSGAGLKAKLEQADMARLDLPAERFDLGHCLVSTFKYLLDEASAKSHLEGVAHALRPGGIYVLGFHLSDYEDERRSRERWVVDKGSTRVTCNIQGWPPDRGRRREDVRSRLVVREQGRELRSETRWTFRTYDAPQVKRLLRQVPALELVAVRDFNYELNEPLALDGERLDVVLVLRKG